MSRRIDIEISSEVCLVQTLTFPSSYLLSDTDVSLPDQDSGVVDRLGKSKLEDLKRNNFRARSKVG